MTLVLNLNLDIVKMYACIENKKAFSRMHTARLQTVMLQRQPPDIAPGGVGLGVPCAREGGWDHGWGHGWVGGGGRGDYTVKSNVSWVIVRWGPQYEQTDRQAWLKNYLPTTSLAGSNKVPSFSSPKVIAWTDTHTDGQTDGHTDRLDWNYYLPTYADDKE